jgi:ankyrin repeat protein
LRDQARDLLKAGSAKSLTAAQFQIARLYGFASWPKLKAHVERLGEIGQLKHAIDTNDLERVRFLMTRSPELHRAPLGYGKNGPLTWVAECRIPWGPPAPERLAMARWMIENGSDVHQGGDGPLMRAALNRDRIPMMERLVSYGADVNANWNGDFPIIWAACEAVNPVSLEWLLKHGADPNCRRLGGTVTALDYLIATYARSTELRQSIDLLAAAGGTTRCGAPVLDILRGDTEGLALWIRRVPQFVQMQFPRLDFGSTGARRLVLRGATLLHVAAEYGSVESAKLLLEHGASVNVAAAVDEAGVGGQTPIFHAVTQMWDFGLEVARLLLDRGADLSVRVKLPGHYERPDEIVECTPLGYALRFPGEEMPGSNQKTIDLLRAHGARD